MIDLNIPGQMSEEELRGVEHLAKRVRPGGHIVEIGSLYGLSSFTWATSVDPSVTVYCIDPWVRAPWVIELVEQKVPNCPEFSFEAFQQYTKSCANIIPIRGYSPDDVKDWGKQIDLIFDDALHHNPFFRNNLRFWLPKVRPGGIMCGHDYCSEWPDVVNEVDRLAREFGLQVRQRQKLWWIELPEKPVAIFTNWLRRRR
jgi:hypothetical protein